MQMYVTVVIMYSQLFSDCAQPSEGAGWGVSLGWEADGWRGKVTAGRCV